MIESIVVLCATKEERQRWIDLLIQEQCTSLLKSPTVPRVSCHHPPYARLSRYFAKLVRRKVIYPELMKKLLYIQYVLRPDMSNVKMRKCNVTYAIFRTCTSEGSESDTLTESNVQEEPRILRKSSLILDVRYVVDNTDLSTVGIAGTSSLTNFAPRVNCDNRCTFETSKSLPAGATMSHVLPNVPLASSKSYTSNLQTRNKFCREHLEISHGRDHSDLTVNYKYLKAIDEFYPKNSDVPVRYSVQNDNCDSVGRETCAIISLRSLDSGMAESYHLRSSEINSCYKSYASSHTKYTDPVRTSHSESDDENKFEHQCICTSPFGSTPRDSVHSLVSSKNIDERTSFARSNDVGDSDTNDNSDNSQKKVQETILIHPLMNYGNVQGKRHTQPIPYAHQCVIKKVGRRVVRPIQPIMEEYDEPTNQVYSSGLYAHWWLKKSIPIFGCTEQGKLPWHGCFFDHFSFLTMLVFLLIIIFYQKIVCSYFTAMLCEVSYRFTNTIHYRIVSKNITNFCAYAFILSRRNNHHSLRKRS